MTGCGVLREGEVGCGVDQGKKLYINIFLFSPGTLFTVLLSLPETVPRFPKFANTLSFINFTFSRDVFFLPSLPPLFDTQVDKPEWFPRTLDLVSNECLTDEEDYDA